MSIIQLRFVISAMAFFGFAIAIAVAAELLLQYYDCITAGFSSILLYLPIFNAICVCLLSVHVSCSSLLFDNLLCWCVQCFGGTKNCIFLRTTVMLPIFSRHLHSS